MRTTARDPRNLLSEDEISSVVRDHLHREGWHIARWTMAVSGEPGEDIVAELEDRHLVVEVKGEGSSKPHTKRYGSPFNSSQVTTHVSVAIYQAMRAVATGKEAAIALPDNERHRSAVTAVYPALAMLSISVYWVDRLGSVTVEGPCSPADQDAHHQTN